MLLMLILSLSIVIATAAYYAATAIATDTVTAYSVAAIAAAKAATDYANAGDNSVANAYFPFMLHFIHTKYFIFIAQLSRAASLDLFSL